MKVALQVKGTVVYVTDVEMTKKEYDAYEERLRSARGFEEGFIAAELIEKAGMDLGDPSGWDDDLTVDTFEPVKPKRRTVNRGAKS